jgi:hypothetical protein
MPHLQSLTVDYLVSGSLDGSTPAPVVSRNGPNSTPFNRTAQIYEPGEVGALGLIDPDLGAGGSIGPRCVSQLVLDLQGQVAPPGARVTVVAETHSGTVELFEVVDLAGKTVVVAPVPFVVPQGGAIQVEGFAAGSEAVLIRVSIETPKDVSELLAMLAIAKGSGGNGGGGGGGSGIIDFSVNAAAADGIYPDDSLVLRTGSRTNSAGAFNGGGAGNKAIYGSFGFDGVPLGDLESLAYVWENLLGPGGPFFLPPTGPTVSTPYVNLVVDFDPLGAGDIRILVTNDDSLNAAITAAIGTYVNNGSNVLTYAWDDTMDVLIVLAPPNAVPGGVAPNVSVGAAWPENSYKFSALVAANPDAVLIDAFTGDGGLPVGSVTPALMLASGDSGNLVKSGKKIQSFVVNGTSRFK